jgi:hypothetical protein
MKDWEREDVADDLFRLGSCMNSNLSFQNHESASIIEGTFRCSHEPNGAALSLEGEGRGEGGLILPSHPAFV